MTDYPPLELSPTVPGRPSPEAPGQKLGLWKVYLRDRDGDQEEVNQVILQPDGWRSGYGQDLSGTAHPVFGLAWKEVCDQYPRFLREVGYRPPPGYTAPTLTFSKAVRIPGGDNPMRLEVEIRVQWRRVGTLRGRYDGGGLSWTIDLDNGYCPRAYDCIASLSLAKQTVGEVGLSALTRDRAHTRRVWFGKRRYVPSGLPRGIGGPVYQVSVNVDERLVGEIFRDARRPISLADPWITRLSCCESGWPVHPATGTLPELKSLSLLKSLLTWMGDRLVR